MTKSTSFAVVAAIALATVAGCGKEESAPTAPPAQPAPNAVKDIQAQGKALADQAAAQGQAVAKDLTALATQKLDQAVKYVKENKVDLADKIVAELEKEKASLSPALQQRLADVRKMIDAAKASGVSIPKL